MCACDFCGACGGVIMVAPRSVGKVSNEGGMENSVTKISYVICPAFSANTFRLIWMACGACIALSAILTPDPGMSMTGIEKFACEFGNEFPMIRMLNRNLHSCYLPVSYGGAVLFGFIVGVIFCFSEFRQPVQPDSVIPNDTKRRWLTWLLMIIVIGSVWLIDSPSPRPGFFGRMSSNRLAVGISAPILFGGLVAAWAWVFIAISVKIREIKCKG
jgi:hypothetical protein